MAIDIEQLKKLPDAPGVYFFLGKNKEILYIGKATSLRDRVRSYFAKDLINTRSPLIWKMVNEEAVSIDFRQTDSVLEALMLEADLIKKFQPKANTDEKDDKSSNCVVITNEDFPKLLLVRKKDVYTHLDEKEIKYVFGPYPHGGQLKEALKIIRKIFPYRDAKCTPAEDQIRSGKTPRACFNRQIGLCPGVCTGEISKKEYGRVVQHLKFFFEGKKKQLEKQLEKEMKEYAKAQEFEKAAKIRGTLYALNHIQDVSLIKSAPKASLNPDEQCFRIEAYDIAHMSGKDTTGVMVVVENGELSKADYRKFKIKSYSGSNDVAGLKEILRRRLRHPEWRWPDIIAVDGSTAQLNAATEVVTKAKEAYEGEMHNISLVAVVKNDAHRPERIIGDEAVAERYQREILLANSEAHRFVIAYHKKLRNRSFL
jgi:excinuclease ABC subunit C